MLKLNLQVFFMHGHCGKVAYWKLNISRARPGTRCLASIWITILRIPNQNVLVPETPKNNTKNHSAFHPNSRSPKKVCLLKYHSQDCTYYYLYYISTEPGVSCCCSLQWSPCHLSCQLSVRQETPLLRVWFPLFFTAKPEELHSLSWLTASIPKRLLRSGPVLFSICWALQPFSTQHYICTSNCFYCFKLRCNFANIFYSMQGKDRTIQFLIQTTSTCQLRSHPFSKEYFQHLWIIRQRTIRRSFHLSYGMFLSGISNFTLGSLFQRLPGNQRQLRRHAMQLLS